MGGRERAIDATIVAAVLVQGQLEAWAGLGATHRPGPAWAQSLALAVAAGLLWWRRTRPLEVLSGVAAVLAVQSVVFGAPEGTAIALTMGVALYAVGRYEDRGRPAWGLAVVAAFGTIWIATDPLNTSWALRLGALVWVAVLVIAWLAGALVRSRATAREQRAIAEAEQRRLALVTERNRIARDLHDAVGHSIAAMTVQAAAVRRRLAHEQAREREALETVEAVGRQAMDEMRRLVGVLREDDAGTREAPHALSDLPRLIASFGTDGPVVDLRSTGVGSDLPTGVELTAYRVVQEGLTNAFRHARRARAIAVELRHEPGRLTVAVHDDGESTAAPVVAGHGLRGMAERVDMYGGSLDAGPAPSGGFSLVAVLPWDRS